MSDPLRTFGEASRSLGTGSVSVLELVRAALERARQHADLNIFLETFDESAIADAARVDTARKNGTAGPLTGMVVALKDNLCYAGHRVSASSRILEGYVSPYSATVVERLRNAGAVILGRTNCDEFAMGSSNENSAYGAVSNPLDPERVPGGSSGGSAAAVAAGICHAALGSDTGGSIRQPASFTGTVGFKPTYGRVSRYGLIAFASSFDQIGPFAHDIEDTARVYEAIAGPDPHDSTTAKRGVEPVTLTDPGKLRIAYYKDALERPGLDPEIHAHLVATIERLRHEGHRVQALELPMLEHLVPTYYILATAEASSNLARFDGVRYGHRSKAAQGVEETYRLSRSEGFGAEVKRRILLGTFVLSAGYYDAYYAQGQRVRRSIREATLSAFNEHDLVLLPTAPITAFKKGQLAGDPIAMYLQDIFTVQANLAGVPAVSVPTGRHSNGLPFGLQLMAAPFDEARLLAAARHLFPLASTTDR